MKIIESPANIKIGDVKMKKKKKMTKRKTLPAHDRVFHIFINKITIASKCDKSPAKRNIFIFYLNIFIYTTFFKCNEALIYFFIKKKPKKVTWLIKF